MSNLSKEIIAILCYAVKAIDYELSQGVIDQDYYDEKMHSLCILNPEALNYWYEQMTQGED